MFFRSKKGNGAGTDSKPDTKQSKPASAAQRVPVVTPSSGKGARESGAGAAPAAEAKPLAPDELKRRAAASKQLAASMGDLIGLMARSPRHRDRKLSDIRWLVVPAIRTGQYSLATAQSKSHGYTAPVAAVLWASVSDEVDKRISTDLASPIKLAPREWKSGNNLWIIDAIGDNRLINELVKRLQTKEWKGKSVKARIVDAQKQVKIRTIDAQPAQKAPAKPNS